MKHRILILFIVLCLISPTSFAFADEVEAPIDAVTPQVETTIEEKYVEDKAPIEESVQEELPQQNQKTGENNVEPVQEKVEEKTEEKVEEKTEEKTEERIQEKTEEKIEEKVEETIENKTEEKTEETPQPIKQIKSAPKTEEKNKDEYTVTYTYRVWDQWQECEQGNLLSEETHSQNYKVGEEVWMPSIVSNGQYYFSLPGHPQEILWAHAGTILQGGGNPEDLSAEFVYSDGYLIPKMIAENVDLVYNYGPLYDTISCEDYLQDDNGEYQLTNSRNYTVMIGNNVQLKSKEIEEYTFNESLSNLLVHVTLRTVDDSIFKLTRYWDKISATDEDDEDDEDWDDEDWDDEENEEDEDEVEEPVQNPTPSIDKTTPIIVNETEDEEEIEEIEDSEDFEDSEDSEDSPRVVYKVITNNNTKTREIVKVVTVEPVIVIEEVIKQEPATIEEPKTPLAKPEGSWALINLIALILSIIIAFILFLFKKDKEENEEYSEEDKKDIRTIRIVKILSILFAIIALILFILTENMKLPMILIDKWTIIMILILIIEIINIFIIKSYAKQNNEEDC